MTPQLITQPRLLAGHPQRPWRPVEQQSQRPARTAARTYRAPVVRELPTRSEYRAATGTW